MGCGAGDGRKGWGRHRCDPPPATFQNPGVVALPYLTLVFGMPMAAGCEGNLLPEVAGCGLFLCQRLPDVSVVVRLGFNRLCGALTTPNPSSSAATVSGCAPLPSQKLLFTLLGEWCLPCRRLPDVDQISAGGWRM